VMMGTSARPNVSRKSAGETVSEARPHISVTAYYTADQPMTHCGIGRSAIHKRRVRPYAMGRGSLS
jgi:hypothetical protein